MTSVLPGLLLLVFIACVALMLSEGLWSNAITFFNVMTAALLATNYFEPLADQLEHWDATYRYLWDFVSVWAIFSGVMLLLRLATDKLSKSRLRFKMPVEWAGGIFFACWTGWIMVCFVTFTLHMAPLSRNFIGGTFQEAPDTAMFFGTAPDRKWLAFVHGMSIDGSLARGRPDGDADSNVFDPQAEFILKYGARRKDFESKDGIRVRTN